MITEFNLHNKTYGFTSEDVNQCTNFYQITEWARLNIHTIASIKIQLLMFKDEKKEDRDKKLKAIYLLECLQYMIEVRLQELNYNQPSV